jgi:ubiquinone/menaquinone biosynthesis C-methylase UbiE
MTYDTMAGRQQYVLGDNPEELVRLDRQAAAIERPTRLLLQTAGLTAGMRVLDLGTGLGHVARLAGEIVGSAGSVLGIDRSEEMLAVARQRTEATNAPHVTFTEGDATTWRAAEPFDAIVARLLLFHVVDPTSVVRHQLRNLRPGGAFIAIDFDLGATRTEPAVPIVVDAMRWIEEAFHVVGAWPRVGTRLGPILRREGLERVGTFGIQPYVPPHDATSATMLASVIRRLGPVIVQHRIASAEQIDPATLEQRIAGAVRDADAVVMLPTVVGAWGYAPGS